jgi:hypothetical protein
MLLVSRNNVAFSILALLLTAQTAEAACGDSHMANFHATPDLLQGKGGELATAVQCYVNADSCDSLVLPELARGADPTDQSQLLLYYGSSIENWCVGLVEDFGSTFRNLEVSLL